MFCVYLAFVAVFVSLWFILFVTAHRKTNFLVNLYWDNKISDSDCDSENEPFPVWLNLSARVFCEGDAPAANIVLAEKRLLQTAFAGVCPTVRSTPCPSSPPSSQLSALAAPREKKSLTSGLWKISLIQNIRGVCRQRTLSGLLRMVTSLLTSSP